MITYEEALAKARDLQKGVNKCTEFEDAYAFFTDNGEYRIGGDSPIAILKEDGRALNFISYAIRCKKIVREMFEV